LAGFIVRLFAHDRLLGAHGSRISEAFQQGKLCPRLRGFIKADWRSA
jgi:hypothetical protein